MSEFRAHVGAEQTFEVLGQTWKLSRWSLAIWREFVAWAKTVLPDMRTETVALVKALEGCEGAQKEVVAAALDELRIPLGPQHPRIIELLNTMEGSIKILHLLLKPGQPNTTEDDAYEVMISLGMGKAQKLFEAAAGIVGPKDEAGAATGPNPSALNGSVSTAVYSESAV